MCQNYESLYVWSEFKWRLKTFVYKNATLKIYVSNLNETHDEALSK